MWFVEGGAGSIPHVSKKIKETKRWLVGKKELEIKSQLVGNKESVGLK